MSIKIQFLNWEYAKCRGMQEQKIRTFYHLKLLYLDIKIVFTLLIEHHIVVNEAVYSSWNIISIKHNSQKTLQREAMKKSRGCTK